MGYSLDIFVKKDKEIKEDWICIICNLLLQSPIVGFPCSHYVCKLCLDRIEISNVSCSRCETAKEDEYQFEKNMGKRSYKKEKDLEKLEVICIANNCSWKGSLKDYDNHCLECSSSCSDEGQNISNELGNDIHDRVTHLEKTVESLKHAFQESYLMLQHRLQINAKNIETIAREIQKTKYAEEKFYGNFTWRIVDIEKRIEEAKMRNTQITSPVFFTSQGGYKLCARVYFNGQEEFMGSHVSFYIIILKGEFDNILSWPFNQHIKVQLLYQNCDGCYEQIFIPDLKSPSTMKPSSIGNTPMALKEYISIDEFNQSRSKFVQDNVLFFRVSVLACGEV